MDIPKYIGLFLLKNSFCYLHGLGNLELKKKSARYEGEALHAPEYDVILTPGGSIDDTFANFIATYEQTSISKAANALREWSTATRAELAAGKEVEIPGVGKFVDASGLVRFVANPHFHHTPAPVPILRMSKRLDDQPDFRRDTATNTSDDERRSSVDWGRIMLIGLLLIGLGVGAYFAYRYFANGPVTTAQTKPADTNVAQPAPSVVQQPASPDSIARHDTPTAMPTPAAPVGSNTDYTVVLNTYPSRTAADKRAATLSRNGNAVSVVAQDSATFLVVTRFSAQQTDTARALDSLRRMFNPKGVRLLR